MPTPFQTLAGSGVPLLIIGSHAVNAHGCPCEHRELECALAATNEAHFAEYLGLGGWNMVYRTQFFAKYRLLSTGTPVLKAMFLDPVTFERLATGGFDFTFDNVTLRVPSLLHVVAMKLQSVKNEPHLEIDEMPQILALLRANLASWKPEDLTQVCDRFGPPEIGLRLMPRLAS